MEGRFGVFWRVKQSKAHLGKHHTEVTKQHISEAVLGEKNGMHRKEPWNKGETKETNDRVKKGGENTSKALKIFYITDEGKEYAKERGENLKSFYETEEGQKLLDEHMRGENHPNHGKPLPQETRDKLSKAQIKRFEDPENHPMFGTSPIQATRDKQSVSMKKFYKEHPEEREKTSKCNIKRFKDPKARDKQSKAVSGEKSGNWHDGISFGSYCPKFNNDLKERVREFFGRCCYLCGKTETENGCKLSVHHVNFDKMVCCNDVKPLFVPLCMSCHGKTQKDREGWEEFFTVSLEYLTDGKCFYTKEEMKNKSQI